MNDTTIKAKGSIKRGSSPHRQKDGNRGTTPSAGHNDDLMLPRHHHHPNSQNESKDQHTSSSAVGPNVMAGLTVAGMAASLLASVFGLFHVETFLSAYQLPAKVYSVGNILYGIINAANDVAGAWMVDYFAASSTSRKRSDLVGVTGCLFAVTFLAPFFRWTVSRNHWLWDGTHFVLSLSLYDTLYSFAMILHGSIVSDDHEMTNATRVRFLTICKIVNLIASLGVARLGLRLFDAQNLVPFQGFLLGLAFLVCGLSIVSQALIVGDQTYSIRNVLVPPTNKKTDETEAPLHNRNLHWRSVVHDFWNHRNFRAWIGTNMLLESANSFYRFYTKTFFDRLIVANGMDKDKCDWIISMARPVTVLLSLVAFIPIRKFGYVKVFRVMFITNAVMSLLMLLVADATSTHWILAYLIVVPVVSAAVHSAVFNLAMADMVMEMKHRQASDGRYDESSLAGLFMGANAVFCKPMEAVLPTVTAQAMSGDERSVQTNLFYVLILPPLIYSCLQLASWKRYTLEPDRVKTLRRELKAMLHLRSSTTTSSAASFGDV